MPTHSPESSFGHAAAVPLAVVALAVVALASLAAPATAQLALVDAQVLTQSLDGLVGTSSDDDAFGTGLAVGDFDGDGRDDLAVGAPGEVVSDIVGAGRVTVIYGAGHALDPASSASFALEDTAFPQAYLDSAFGAALAAGDFDADGYDDLAIGVPGHYYLPMGGGGTFESGAVVVLYGGASGLGLAGQQLFRDGLDGVGGAHESHDRFGEVLAAGDFDDDGYADLAVGVPRQHSGGIPDSGKVTVIYGSAVGLSPTMADEDAQHWAQAAFGLDANGVDDHFGASLGVGDFDGDGYADLAVGTPGDEVTGAPAAGSVTVIFGSATGLGTADAQRLAEAGPTPGEIGALDHFGAAVAAGDFDCDGIDDLAIGVPDGNLVAGGVALASDVGGVLILRGSLAGVIADEGDLLDRTMVAGAQAAFDHFGEALVAGRFAVGGCDDLVVGAPGVAVAGNVAAGEAYVFAGSPTAAPAHVFTASQEAPAPDTPEYADHLGSRLVVGDFRGDGLDDLALGVPDDSALSHQDAGRVMVFYSDARIFVDGFESGDTTAWSSTTGG